MALAVVVWANDKEKSSTPWRVIQADGGTRNHTSGLNNNVYFQYAWMSNEMINPRILACPSDKVAKPADTWNASPAGGLLNPNFRNDSCSYFIGMDAGAARAIAGQPGGEILPFELSQEHIVFGDRNLNAPGGFGGGCSAGVNPVGAIGRPFATSWLLKPNYGHGNIGNVALLDGSVQKAPRQEVNLLLEKGDDNGSIHMLYPRPAF